MDALTSLLLANVLFVGTHFLMSHPLRAGMVRALGEKGFLGVYSLVSLAFFVWVVIAFRSAPGVPMLWDGTNPAPWIIASVLTIVATALFLGSFRSNPALPDTPIDTVVHAEATGAFAVTRHPMMWAFGLWAVAHILAWPSMRTVITAGAIGVLAFLGARLQDAKKETLLGEAWKGWEAKTSYWPRLGKLGDIGVYVWLLAVALWLAFTWMHLWWAGLPAGVWLWLA